MSWIILYDPERKQGVFGCNTTDIVFGHLMDGEYEEIERFGQSLSQDPRRYDIEELYERWLNFSAKKGGEMAKEILFRVEAVGMIGVIPKDKLEYQLYKEAHQKAKELFPEAQSIQIEQKT